jgi:CBS domain-containing protein
MHLAVLRVPSIGRGRVPALGSHRSFSMKVSEAMTREVSIVSPEDTLQQAAKKMAELDAGVLPVGANDRLVGMLTDRDITVRAVATGKDPSKTKLSDISSHSLAAVRPDQPIEDAIKVMKSHDVKRVVVMTDSHLEGIVSLADLARNNDDADVEDDISRAEPNN